MNQLNLIGNVVAEPTQKTLASGTIVTQFRLAVDRPKRKNEETGKWEDNGTDYFFVDCWNGVAKAVAANVSKGDLVAALGSAKTSSRERDGGGYDNFFSCNAREVKFLRLKGKETTESVATESAPPVSEDDIPF